jgi:hypothetical protein
MVEVRIGPPARSRGDWACRLCISGLPRDRDIDRLVYGIDSVQALELPLFAAARLLATSPEFRAGQIESLGKPALYPAALVLPLPLHSLQGTLENLQAYLERKAKADGNPEWRRGLLSAMREISADLATLAAYVPARPRKRPNH